MASSVLPRRRFYAEAVFFNLKPKIHKMNIYNLSSAYTEMKAEFTLLGIIDKPFSFACIFDGKIVYDLTHDNMYHEISIVCDLSDNDFLFGEKLYGLAGKYGIKYFEHRIYGLTLQPNGEYPIFGGKKWVNE